MPTRDVRKERIVKKFRKYACISHIFVLYYLTRNNDFVLEWFYGYR